MALEMEGLKAEVERARAGEEAARANESKALEELRMADQQILALSEYKTKMSIVLEGYQAAEDLAEQMQQGLKYRIAISKRERDEALADARRTKFDLADLTHKTAKKAKKWHKQKAKLNNKIKESEVAKSVAEANHDEQIRIAGGVAGAKARLEMLVDYREGRESSWNVTEEIADCKIVLGRYGHLYKSFMGGEEQGSNADDVERDTTDDNDGGGEAGGSDHN